MASGCGATIDLDALPLSEAFVAERGAKIDARMFAATGGDDYELCFTAAAHQRDVLARIAGEAGIRIKCIGRIVSGDGVTARLADGSQWQPLHAGYVHFD